MKRIAIFQSDLNVGGIQKSLINILNELDFSKYIVDLYLFDRTLFFDLPEHENLNIIYGDAYPMLYRLVYFNLLRKLFPSVKTDTEYDVAIDFNSYRNECSVGATLVKAKKRISFIHNDVKIKRENEIKYRVLWHFFKGKFKHFDEFAAVSPGIIDSFRELTGIHDKKIHVLPNHINTQEIFTKSKLDVDFSVDPSKYNLCTVGRLCHQKGYDILLGYMKEVFEKRQDMHLYFIGDGPDHEALENQANELGISEHITFLGNQANPFCYMDKMDGFVLTSRYEGQGMVIWEAKALGLELFISRNLEKYNPGIEGRDSIVDALSAAERREKVYDDLHEYNESIRRGFAELLETD